MKNQLIGFKLIFAISIGLTSLNAEDYAIAGFVKGKVTVLSAGDTSKLWKAFKVNDVIKPGDTLKTGNGSKVDLIYKETEFRIQPNTTFALKEWDTNCLLYTSPSPRD